MKLTRLIDWSQNEFSFLSWRKDRTLYKTLVSEIMLQQTTVGTVKNYFDSFVEKFPDLKSLAVASNEELVIAWKGLGYYRRARNLKKIAEAIYSRYRGEFPLEIGELIKIPGIGPYTANALLAIGMDKRALAVDANLERVISRLFTIDLPKGPKLQNEIQKLFLEKKIFNTKVSFRKLNEALMDLGRTYCQSGRVQCDLCPLKSECQAFLKGDPTQYPFQIKKKITGKKNEIHELYLLRVIVRKGNYVLAYKKSEREWLSGQYELPTFILKTTDSKIMQYPRLKLLFPIEGLKQFKTSITKYKITNSVLVTTERELKKLSNEFKLTWLEMDHMASNFSTASLKAMKLLKD